MRERGCERGEGGGERLNDCLLPYTNIVMYLYRGGIILIKTGSHAM